jgi:predicted DNA-binding protein (MmcQ/YjbR family)
VTPAAIETHCLALAGATVSVQWGDSRVFKVGGKMFAVLWRDGHAGLATLSFKAGDIAYAMLIEQDDIEPAPYLARAGWVRLTRLDALASVELEARLAAAHAMVVARLPKKLRPAV